MYIKARTLSDIANSFQLEGEIFIFEDKNNADRIAITYNILKNEKYDFPKNTFQIHRNKMTNTLYTLNALNELIKRDSEVENVSKENYKVNWEKYKDSLVIMQKETKESDKKVLSVIPLVLKDVKSAKVA
jgi:nicotinic acid mononucleotide adenylyltransferase